MKTLMIGDQLVGDNQPSFFIAEAGINHQGDLDTAFRLIDVAVEAGASAVKFQKRTISRILTAEGLKRPYATPNSFGPTYGEHKIALEFDGEAYEKIVDYCKEKEILFLASAWDEESVDFLEELDIVAHKVASADLTNKPLLHHMARTGKPIILSTGMSHIEEVDEAVELIQAYHDKFVVLQCTSTYPSRFDQINLNVIPMYRERYESLVGYSGHERGLAVTLAAVVKGACVIERHFTLDRTMKGGDHAASLEPVGLKKLIRDIRVIEEALGDGVKTIYPEELPVRQKLAKSVVSAVDLNEGVILTREMLTTKGPGTGISAGRLDDVVGKGMARTVPADTVLQQEDISW